MKYAQIKSPEDLYYYIKKSIDYGFVNQSDKVFLRNNTNEYYYMEELFRNYKFQCAAEVILNKCGICYDQNELMRYWLDNNGYEVSTYYCNIRNHSFLVYKDQNKYKWLETTYKKTSGIHSFYDLEDLFNYYLYTQQPKEEAKIFEYNIKDYGCDIYTFIEEARNSKLVLKK